MLTSCDVLVAGGGVAGVAAAVAAARRGARTVLAEKDGFLGGTGYAGLLQHICGLYAGDDALPRETLNQGICREIEQALLGKSPERKIKKIGKVWVLPYRREDLLSVLADLCAKEKNLEVYQDTAVASAESRDNGISSVRLKRPGSEYSLIPGMVIDCTGDAAVAAMAGAEARMASYDERQMAGYVMLIAGLQAYDETLSLKVPYQLARAVQRGILGPSARFTVFSPGDSPGEGYCKMSIEGEASPGRNERARTEATAIHKYLASVLPEFGDSSLSNTSLRVMDREGRRIAGEYTLTEQDALSSRKFEDGVVRNAWPIEIWDRSRGTIYKYVANSGYYEIPFRCLRVKGVHNMLAAGRCISVSHEALGSPRVMGTCMALGDAAGRAGAFWVKNGKYPEGRF
jgi:hypothetical protein